MTNTRLGKKKSFDSEKSTITKIKEKKIKPSRFETKEIPHFEPIVVSLPTPKNKQEKLPLVKNEESYDERRKERRREKRREKREEDRRKKEEQISEVNPDVKQEVKREVKKEKNEVKPEENSEKKSEVNSEVKSEEKSKVKPEVKKEKEKVKPQVKSEVKSEDKAQVNSEGKPQVKPEDKAQIKSEEKSEDKAQVKSGEKSEVKPKAKKEKKGKSKAKRELKQKETQDDKKELSPREKRHEGQKERSEELKKLRRNPKNHKGEYCHPNDIIRGKNRTRFEPYINPVICDERVKEGKYYRGIIRINRRNRSDAYVTCDNLDADIFINGQHDRNRALEGDTVVVELLDLETIWAKKKESMIQKREQRHSTAAERPPQEEGEDDKGKPKYVGKVVYVSSENKHRSFSGTLSTQQRFTDNEPVDIKNVRLAWFKPIDQRTPLIAIQLKYAPKDLLTNEEKYKDLLMVAKITRWPIDSMNPFGVVERELGHIGNIAAETEAVLADNNIIEKPFGQKALNALPEVPWSIKPSDIEKRRDLRNTRIFTIDPATAKGNFIF